MISFSQYLTEGLIKLPEKMLKEGQKLIITEICSYVVSVLESKQVADYLDMHNDSTPEKKADVAKFIAHVKDISTKYDAKVKFLKKKYYSRFKLKVDLSGLPEKYKKILKDKKIDDVYLVLNWERKGRLQDRGAGGTYNDEDLKIVLSIANIVATDFEKDYVRKMKKHLYQGMVDVFDDRIDHIMQAFEHELTHFVQYRVLRGADERQVDSDNLDRENHHKDDVYYNSQIEFDPQVKSALALYRQYEKDNLHSKLKGNRRQWVDYFVGAKIAPKGRYLDDLVGDEKHGGFVKLSRFFESLKKHSPDKWKKAIKLFTQELDKRYPQ